MVTHIEDEYICGWINSDGSFVGLFKAEFDAPYFRLFPNGDLIPDAYWSN